MKITKATVFKLIAATIVPGGFILWGLHELSKYRASNKKVPQDSNKTGTRE